MMISRLKYVLLFLILGFGCSSSSWSHLNSISYSQISHTTDTVHVELRMTMLCIQELFALDVNMDGNLSDEEITPARPLLHFYFQNKIKVLAQGRQLPLELKEVVFAEEEDDSYLILSLDFTGERELEDFILFCNVSEEADPYHRNLSELQVKGRQYTYVFTSQNYFDSAHPPKPDSVSAARISPATAN
ncbi:MAG: hypothetical protein ACOX5R_04145 [bacterium]|jgi:hypothetical protein